MTPRLELGVLDFCRVGARVEPERVLWGTIRLASYVEELGYARYWLTEHHTPDVAQSTPEVFLPILAGMTRRIRVGVAGVLLRYHSPLRIAKVARLLATMFPGRIDLGVARGLVDPHVSDRFTHDGSDDAFRAKVEELAGYLRGGSPIPVNPIGTAAPHVWGLGARAGSVGWAADHGAAFCAGVFLSGEYDGSLQAVHLYRERFRAGLLERPEVALAIAGVCRRSRRAARAAVEAWGPGARATVVGEPAECADAISGLAARFGTSNIVFLDMSPTEMGRRTSYRLLAEALGL